MKEKRKHTLETGFFELALDAGFLAVDAGLADAFEAGFADPAREALDAGFSAAFEAGLDAGAALLAGLEAALEAGLAYTKKNVYQYDEKIKRVKKLKEKRGESLAQQRNKTLSSKSGPLKSVNLRAQR